MLELVLKNMLHYNSQDVQSYIRHELECDMRLILKRFEAKPVDPSQDARILTILVLCFSPLCT
jgi:hypothetical protein